MAHKLKIDKKYYQMEKESNDDAKNDIDLVEFLIA